MEQLHFVASSSSRGLVVTSYVTLPQWQEPPYVRVGASGEAGLGPLGAAYGVPMEAPS